MTKGKISKDSVLGEIIARVNALKPDQYIAPSQRRDDTFGYVQVGMMSDYSRRIWTVSSMLRVELNQLYMVAQGLQEQIEAATASTHGDDLQVLKHLASGGLSSETIEKYEAAVRDFNLKREISDFATKLFWLEIRSQFSGQFVGKVSAAVRDDWSVGYESRRPDPILEMLKNRGLGSLDSLLAHMFERA